MAVNKGVAISFGVSASEIAGFTGAVSGGYKFTAADLSKTANKLDIADGDGEITSQYIYGGSESLSLKAYFAGSSLDVTSTPAVGEVCTITAANNADIAGNWLVDQIAVSESNESHTTFDLTLSRVDGITL